MGWAPVNAKYSHDALAELIIANPTATDRELGAQLGRSKEWIGMVRRSDMFQEILHRRGADIADPILTATVEQRLDIVAKLSLEKLGEKLARPAEEIPDNLLIAAATLGAKGLGVGGFSNKPPPPPAIEPAVARLERLQDRLLHLNGVKPQEISDAQIVAQG